MRWDFAGVPVRFQKRGLLPKGCNKFVCELVAVAIIDLARLHVHLLNDSLNRSRHEVLTRLSRLTQVVPVIPARVAAAAANRRIY